MKKMVLDSIKNDDLWVFKTDYKNTDTSWLELVSQCIGFHSIECLTYLLEDMDFVTIDDYVRSVDEAIKYQSLGALGCVLKKSESFGMFKYLATVSIDKQQEFLQSIMSIKNHDSVVAQDIFEKPSAFTLLDCIRDVSVGEQKLILHNLVLVDYPVDYEELFESNLIVQKTLLEILKEATFGLQSLVSYLWYLEYAEIQLEQAYYTKVFLSSLERVDSIPYEVEFDLFGMSIVELMDSQVFDIALNKCKSGLDTVLIDGDLSDHLVETILKKFVNNACSGWAINEQIDIVAQLIESDSNFAKSIISHRDFEFDTAERAKTRDELQSWDFSIARNLYDKRKFEAIKVLVRLGAKLDNFIKLYIRQGSYYFLADSLFDNDCKEDDYQHFYLEVQTLIDNGLLDSSKALTCNKNGKEEFDLVKLSKIF
ncbi:hypothetical protein [Vibrio maerlii]|uniref:hypothetical protein n=1 Tax=Vibrio maerlii TaxID=2231648 RepID=UPI000E3CACED|nr:hypothetical protein [Vibrio maerlii]